MRRVKGGDGWRVRAGAAADRVVREGRKDGVTGSRETGRPEGGR